MGGTATEAALERVERALARVERATEARGELREDYARLDSRHDLLRARVQETIAQLDGLIADAAKTSEPAR